jgi:hypothetical protein
MNRPCQRQTHGSEAPARRIISAVPQWELNLPDRPGVELDDLFTEHRFFWHGKVQHAWLDPGVNPCAIWRITPPGLPG